MRVRVADGDGGDGEPRDTSAAEMMGGGGEEDGVELVTCPSSPIPDGVVVGRLSSLPTSSSPSSMKRLSSDHPVPAQSVFPSPCPTHLAPRTTLPPPLHIPSSSQSQSPAARHDISPPSPSRSTGRYEDFSSPWYVTAVGYALVVVMLAANVYVVVQLAMGSAS